MSHTVKYIALTLGLFFLGGLLAEVSRPGVAQAQAVKPGGGSSFTGSYSSYTATTASGNNAFSMLAGARICLNSDASCNSRIYLSSGRMLLDVASANVIDANGGTGTVRFPFSINVERGVQIGAGGTARPTCDTTTRGMYFVTRGGTGVADVIEFCAKNSADTYAWIVK